MSRTRKHPKRRKPFNPVKTFFKVMLSIVMVFVVLAGGACFAYHKVTGEWPFGGDTIAKDADETSMLDAILIQFDISSGITQIRNGITGNLCRV